MPRLLILLLACVSVAFGQTYDLVIANARVIDPESRLDAVRFVGINAGKIARIAPDSLSGKRTIDAKGLVLAPGFIDLHSHGQDPENYILKAFDGVTTALELEVGAHPVDQWYEERRGKSLIHYGASAGHLPVRMAAMGDRAEFLPSGRAAKEAASTAEQQRTLRLLEQGIRNGGVGIGMGLAYTPFASRAEILEIFASAAKLRVPVFVHMRFAGARDPGVLEALQEVISDAAATGASLHVVHINSTSGDALSTALSMIDGARQRGIDVTTETYPYTAGNTRLESAIFNPGWQEQLGITYGDLMWADTGERLTEETFAKYRKQGGSVIIFSMKEQNIDRVVAHPGVMIASDGGVSGGKGHPRSAGTYTRILAHYVREKKSLSLMQAIEKMTLLPARRLESFVPAMKNKGRIREGADADLVLFDPATIQDRASYQDPKLRATGVRHLLVNGIEVIREGNLVEGILPGQPVRSQVR